MSKIKHFIKLVTQIAAFNSHDFLPLQTRVQYQSIFFVVVVKIISTEAETIRVKFVILLRREQTQEKLNYLTKVKL